MVTILKKSLGFSGLLSLSVYAIIIQTFKLSENKIEKYEDDTIVPEELADSRFKLTFVKLEDYNGSIIVDLPPDMNRNMSSYIKDKVTKWPDCMNFEKTRLLIVVKSAVQYAERRQVIRDTWKKFVKKYDDIFVVNVVGKSEEDGTEEDLKNESEKFCDIIQINVLDHYFNTTLKMVGMLKHILDNDNLKPDFILMVDDDSFVNITFLYDILFNQKSLSRNDHVIWGRRFPVMKGYMPEYNITEHSTNNCPDYLFNGYYPEWCSGHGYVLPYSVIPCLYHECMRMPFFHMDDLFITGFAAERCGFPRRHIKGFNNDRKAEVELTDLVQHYSDREKMSRYYEWFKKLQEDGRNFTDVRNITDFET